VGGRRRIEVWAGYGSDWTVRSYEWRSPTVKSPFTDRNMRAIVVKDEDGNFRPGLRNGNRYPERGYQTTYHPFATFDKKPAAIDEAKSMLHDALLEHEFAVEFKADDEQRGREMQAIAQKYAGHESMARELYSDVGPPDKFPASKMALDDPEENFPNLWRGTGVATPSGTLTPVVNVDRADYRFYAGVQHLPADPEQSMALRWAQTPYENKKRAIEKAQTFARRGARSMTARHAEMQKLAAEYQEDLRMGRGEVPPDQWHSEQRDGERTSAAPPLHQKPTDFQQMKIMQAVRKEGQHSGDAWKPIRYIWQGPTTTTHNGLDIRGIVCADEKGRPHAGERYGPRGAAMPELGPEEFWATGTFTSKAQAIFAAKQLTRQTVKGCNEHALRSAAEKYGGLERSQGVAPPSQKLKL